MVPLLPILFAIAVTVPPPVTSPEAPIVLPITSPETTRIIIPTSPLSDLNISWWTHDSDFVPAALLPRPRVSSGTRPVLDATPAPEPPTATSGDSGMGSNTEQWRDLVTQYFPGEVDLALCVIRGESGGNPSAENPRSSAAGLWQFLRSTWDNMVPSSVTGGSYSSGAVFDPVASTRAAAWLRNAAGWSQWNAAARCR